MSAYVDLILIGWHSKQVFFLQQQCPPPPPNVWQNCRAVAEFERTYIKNLKSPSRCCVWPIPCFFVFISYATLRCSVYIIYHIVVDSKCGSWSVPPQMVWTSIAVLCKYLPNVKVQVRKPAEDSKVKSSEALWFASLPLTSVEVNARYRIWTMVFYPLLTSW